jgi:uncharacterized repeat protein (TIGR01451 family)
LRLTADKTEVRHGETITFKIEVTNKGSVIAPDVVVTDKLPAGVTVDSAMAKSSTGLVQVDGNDVTAQLGDLAPADVVVVEIPAMVGGTASNVSNQASALYTGAANPTLSNAYIAQVAAPPEEPQAQPTAAQPTAEVAPTLAPAPEEPTATAVVMSEPTAVTQAPEPTVAVAPTPRPNPTQATTTTGGGGSANQSPKAPIPQTGGAFPLTFALLLLVATLVARYLRGHIRSRNGRRT